MSGGVLLLAAGWVVLAIVSAAWVSRRIWTRPSTLRRAVGRLTVSACTLAVVFLLGEAYFKFVWLEPDGFGASLHTRLWARKYLHPRNSLGYRDGEHPPEAFEGKRSLFVVGDSFVEGAGLRDWTQRTSNVLADRLGPEWEVVNLAKGGWGVLQEHGALARYPQRPDVVVLVYYVNDVLQPAARQGRSLRLPERPEWLRRLTSSSYFLDFLYWRTYRASLDEALLLEFIEQCFADPAVRADHLEELEGLVDWLEERSVKLHVVVFPHLAAVERTRPLTDVVTSHLRERGVDVIDMAQHLAGRAPETLVVGRHDSHPCEEVHVEVAARLLERLQSTAGR